MGIRVTVVAGLRESSKKAGSRVKPPGAPLLERLLHRGQGDLRYLSSWDPTEGLEYKLVPRIFALSFARSLKGDGSFCIDAATQDVSA